MLSATVSGNSVTTATTVGRRRMFSVMTRISSPRSYKILASSMTSSGLTATLKTTPNKDKIVTDSLRVLEWDKLCDSVATFAATYSGKKAVREQLWSLDTTYEESLSLLNETSALVQMHDFGAMLEFISIDSSLVELAIQCAKRDSPVSAQEAVAVLALLQFMESLQFNLKAAIKRDSECYQRFMPLSQRIMELVVSRSLMKYIQQLIDEDGFVKDSASSALKQSRDQVRFLERKLQDLMASLMRNDMNGTSSLEISNVDGRWCISSSSKLQTSFDGLLLSRWR
ncbi:OLC1v1020968C1 [Oldenlandia corymbosa var. corymbosa]|uniref:OLC1v1020968C1 n=1 Tax=Oldenlandia corymbosa var. corymbosa TaxID=529605 RepID=A0AAV1BWW6_OLDCO|nr:OLC1v1020968C1 [Oldenlandia corymbosa var. corymbosa]